MSDQEFDVMDELYFVQSFEEVRAATGLETAELKQVLQHLLEKGWVRCMESREGDNPGGVANFEENYQAYFFLATKAGLLAHNSR